jgi:hypothetical protein
VELEAAIKQALLDDWDPLHVAGTNGAAMHYSCEIQDLTVLLLGKASDADLVEYLRGAEVERHGLGAADEARVARAVAALRRAVDTRAAS